MKITFVSSEFYPISKAAAIRIKPIVDEFINQSHDVTIITSNHSKEVLNYKIKSSFFSGPSNKSKVFKRLIEELLFSIDVSFRLLFTESDLIFITTPPFFLSILCSLIARIKKTKYIIDVRDDYPRAYKDAGILKSTSFLYKILLRAEKSIYNHSVLITCATSNLKPLIESKKDSDIEVYVLKNGFLKETFKPNQTKYEQFTLVFHGNISTQQNPLLLIDIAKELDKHGIQVIIIGQGSNDRLFKEKNLTGNINYMGQVDYNKIPGIISRCHMGISVRKDGELSKDSFPVKIYEYIGVEIPCIITPLSEAGDFAVKKNIGFQFRNDEKEKIIEYILMLKNNEAKYKQFVKNISFIRDDFSREKIVQKFTDFLFNYLK
jgi:glycosyltransferase involved in cell wall biosynthesis